MTKMGSSCIDFIFSRFNTKRLNLGMYSHKVRNLQLAFIHQTTIEIKTNIKNISRKLMRVKMVTPAISTSTKIFCSFCIK